MPVLFRDDNHEVISAAEGMRPIPGTAGIIAVTMTAATQELALKRPVAASTPSVNTSNDVMLRIVTGAQPALYALGATGGAASFTDKTTMQYLPAYTIEHVRAKGSDVSIYVLSATAGGDIQISALE